MSIRHYVCQFRIHNFTYIYRCRADDQYCCGYTCCFKPLDDAPKLLESWYFWSLISLVLIVFGCIIFSFALSNLKRKSSSWTRAPSAWLGLMSGGSVNLGNLATTTVGQSGIIQPSILYKKNQNTYQVNPADDRTQNAENTTRPTTRQIHRDVLDTLDSDGPGSRKDSGIRGKTPNTEMKQKSPKSSKKRKSESDFDWVSQQLKPLSAPYKSAWNGQPIDMRLNPTAASAATNSRDTTTVNRTGILPPGFINT